ncbi:MAG TPA: hypothetical protein EYN33_03695 [Gammaproteobacteria bacterium]|nr:hypothetical protein [Gammaproteobacteria bacterium]
MKVFKWLGIVVGVYVVFVLLFESVFLGYYQPSFEDPEGCSSLGEDCGIPMILITTIDDKGQSTDRMVARFVSTDGKIYVSAHHWTRGWYKEAIKNPNVKGEIQGEVKDYVALPVEGDEFEMVALGFPLPLPAKIMMGFPPKRQILRLDPNVE